jgi:hypothetical protein
LECKNRCGNDIEHDGNKWYIYKAIGSADDVRNLLLKNNLKITEHYRLIESPPIRHRKAMTSINGKLDKFGSVSLSIHSVC